MASWAELHTLTEAELFGQMYSQSFQWTQSQACQPLHLEILTSTHDVLIAFSDQHCSNVKHESVVCLI